MLGSNIGDILLILGIAALITPIPAEPRFFAVDMWWVAGSALGLTVIAVTLGGLPRKAGGGLLLAYAVYVAFMG